MAALLFGGLIVALLVHTQRQIHSDLRPLSHEDLERRVLTNLSGPVLDETGQVPWY